MSKYFSFLRKKRSSLHEEEVGNKGKRHQKKSLGSSPSPSPGQKGLEAENRFSVHNLDVFDDLKEDVFLSDNDSVLDNVSFGEIALEGEADRKGGDEKETPISASRSSPKTCGDPRSDSVSHLSEGTVDEDEGHVMDANDEDHDDDINDFMDEAFNDLEDEEVGHEANEMEVSGGEGGEILSDNHFVTIVPVSFGVDAYRQLEEDPLARNEVSRDADDDQNDRLSEHHTSTSPKIMSDVHETTRNGDTGGDVPSDFPLVETRNIPHHFKLDIKDSQAGTNDVYTEGDGGIAVATEATTSTPILSVSFMDEWGKLTEIPAESLFPGDASCGPGSLDSTPLTIPEEILNEGETDIDPHFITCESSVEELGSVNDFPRASIPTGKEIGVLPSIPDDPCPQGGTEHVNGISSVSTPPHVNGETERPSNLTLEHPLNVPVPTERNGETGTISIDEDRPCQTSDIAHLNGRREEEKDDSIATPEYEDADAKFECSSLDTEIEIRRICVGGDDVCVSGLTTDPLTEGNGFGGEPDTISRSLSKELHYEETGGLLSDNDTMDELLTKSESSSVPFLSCERPSLCPSDLEEDVFDSAKEDLSEDEGLKPRRRDTSSEDRRKDSLRVPQDGETSCDNPDSEMRLLDTMGDVAGKTPPPDAAFERKADLHEEAAGGNACYDGARLIDSEAKVLTEGIPGIDACLVSESDSSSQEVDKNANKTHPDSPLTHRTLSPPTSSEDTNVNSTENFGTLPLIDDRMAQEKDKLASHPQEKDKLSSHPQEKDILSSHPQEKDKNVISPEYIPPNSSSPTADQSRSGHRGLTPISESPGASDQKMCLGSDLASKLTEAPSDPSDSLLPRRSYCTSEENFLINIVNSERLRAEARLAQRRAARAEARELRLRELERQQQEQENNDDEEQCSGMPNALVATHTPAVPAVNSTFSPSEMTHPRAGRSRSSVAASSVSRRSSEDSTADDALPISARELKADLKELDDKFRKAMITNAQLDNEKATLTFEVEFLKDKYSELEENHTQLTKDHRKKCSENEQLRKLSNKLKEEVQMVRRVLQERDELIQEYGLVLIGEEDGENSYDDMDDAERRDDTVNALSPRRIAVKKALLSHEASELLAKGAATGSLDVRLRKYAEDKNDLEDEVRRLKMELEEELSRRRKENGLDHEKQKEASKSLNEYKFRVQKAEAEVSTLQANVARLESLVSRYKASTEQLEQSEEELKSEKRRLQRELRDAQNRLEELELTNSHIQKRLDKLKTARSTLLKDLSQEPA